MKILRVKKTSLYDVFTGNGWYNHTRVHFSNKGLTFVSGKKLPKNEVLEIHNVVKSLNKEV